MSKFPSIRYVHDTFDLNEKTFFLYAEKNYENRQCHDIEEFYNDLQTPMHLKKLFTRYQTNGVLKDRLIINHIICFFNLFEPFAACKILFFKIEEKHHVYLKTFLQHLNKCPEYILINGAIKDLSTIEIDDNLMKQIKASQQ